VYDEVYRISNESEFNRKLFVHGLPYEISSDAVRRVFEELGEVENAHVIVDKTSGKGKGYGFVTYKSADSAFLALQRTFDFDVRTS
jgi:heterogeneous nuclear ribonucleoprotein A1/A3